MADATRRTSLRHWSGWDYLPGMAFIVIGVLAITEAPVASIAAAIYMGAMLCVAGTFGAVGGFAHVGRRGALLAALLGILSLIIGAAILFNPVAGAVSLTWLLGAWFVVGGILELAMGFSVRVGRGWLILVGVLNLVLGAWVLMMKPASAFVLLGYLVGFSFLIRGLWSVIFVSEVHHSHSAQPHSDGSVRYA